MKIHWSAPADVVEELAANLHPADAAELEAAGLGLHEALSAASLNALRDGDTLIALFGVAPHPSKGWAVPWMLCTRAIDGVPKRAMAKVSRAVVDSWQEHFEGLENMVHADNARAVRFLEWLGFNIEPGAVFRRFTWSRHV